MQDSTDIIEHKEPVVAHRPNSTEHNKWRSARAWKLPTYGTKLHTIPSLDINQNIEQTIFNTNHTYNIGVNQMVMLQSVQGYAAPTHPLQSLDI